MPSQIVKEPHTTGQRAKDSVSNFERLRETKKNGRFFSSSLKILSQRERQCSFITCPNVLGMKACRKTHHRGAESKLLAPQKRRQACGKRYDIPKTRKKGSAEGYL